MHKYSYEFVELIGKYDSITILTHVNPDADTIGTGLGIYAWLKEQGKRVEISSFSTDLPKSVQFLPYFDKIKHKIDFNDSLIVACDAGSMDRLGFDLSARDIINIDHHKTNTRFGILNIVDDTAVSSSEIAFYLLKSLGKISSKTATAFYAALASDSRNFTTSNMKKDTFKLADNLVGLGADAVYISREMINNRSLASLRILGLSLGNMILKEDAKIAVMPITKEQIKQTGAVYSDLDGIVDYAKSLVTVDIGIMILDRGDDIKVSIRSKSVDISSLSESFGGGGHKLAGGFSVTGMDIEQLTDKLISEIKERGLI